MDDYEQDTEKTKAMREYYEDLNKKANPNMVGKTANKTTTNRVSHFGKQQLMNKMNRRMSQMSDASLASRDSAVSVKSILKKSSTLSGKDNESHLKKCNTLETSVKSVRINKDNLGIDMEQDYHHKVSFYS